MFKNFYIDHSTMNLVEKYAEFNNKYLLECNKEGLSIESYLVQMINIYLDLPNSLIDTNKALIAPTKDVRIVLEESLYSNYLRLCSQWEGPTLEKEVDNISAILVIALTTAYDYLMDNELVLSRKPIEEKVNWENETIYIPEGCYYVTKVANA